MSVRIPRPMARHIHAMATPKANVSDSKGFKADDAVDSSVAASLPTGYTPLSAKELRNGLATLPQELYDDIYDLTFTAASGIRDLGKIISRKNDGSTFTPIVDIMDCGGSESGTQVFHSSPGTPFLGADSRALLQVDRASRAQFAASYYHGIFYAQNKLTAQTWIRIVALAHRKLIRQVWIVREDLSLGGSAFRRFYLDDVSSAFMGIRREVARRLQRRHPGARLPGPETAQDTRSYVRVAPYIESLAFEILRTDMSGSRHSIETRAYCAQRAQRAQQLGVGESRRPMRGF